MLKFKLSYEDEEINWRIYIAAGQPVAAGFADNVPPGYSGRSSLKSLLTSFG
jgi:hypothetical protein